jgi:hypothetical protein
MRGEVDQIKTDIVERMTPQSNCRKTEPNFFFEYILLYCLNPCPGNKCEQCDRSYTQQSLPNKRQRLNPTTSQPR